MSSTTNLPPSQNVSTINLACRQNRYEPGTKWQFIVDSSAQLENSAIVVGYLFYKDPAQLDLLILNYGVLGLFIGSIIANASILLPLPIDIFVFLLADRNFFGLGAVDPVLLGIIVGFGAAIGEMSGYIIGLLGIKSLEKLKQEEIGKIQFVKGKIRELGMVFIALGAFTPFPFDIIGIGAGLIKFPPQKFFIAALFGKLLRYIVIALAGFYSIPTIKVFFGF